MSAKHNLGTLGIYVRTVDSVAALSVIPDFIYPDGSKAFVSGVGSTSGQIWTYDKESKATVDGTTVASTRSGIGRWLVNSGLPTSPPTVIGGTTYTLSPYDNIVSLDSSNGLLPVAQMISPLLVGQMWTFWWKAWVQATPLPPQIVAPSGVLIMPFSGQTISGTSGWTSSTTITTPGATWTIEWDGMELISV